MKLNEFENNKSTIAAKALTEHYELPFNVAKLNMSATKTMLGKVRNVLRETKQSADFYKKSTSPSYMKMVFMEQSLTHHFYDLKNMPKSRIFFENEEVEKSQVVLAAQDLVDQIQKMLEDVGQMQVKELPALVSSIESEIGVSESMTYNDQVTQQLDTLTATLKEALAGMKAGLNGITGQAVDAAFDAGAEMGADEIDADAMGTVDMGAEEIAPPVPELPEAPPVGGAGRAKR